MPRPHGGPARLPSPGLTGACLLRLAAIAWSLVALPAAAQDGVDELTEMALEDLMQVEVTSVSKKVQNLLETASAVYVVTGADIKASGATNIPEALRLVPGVNVGQISADKWAISIRGQQRLFADKLLVLVDGRSVYWSLYSGVLWALQDMLLEDVDRIEVIRGPGSSIWGANAVNGVINIITKRAGQTQGTYASVLAASNGDGLMEARVGGAFSEASHYRVYAKGRHLDQQPSSQDTVANDDVNAGNVGFRVDGATPGGDEYSLQGQVQRLDLDESRIDFDTVPPYAETDREEGRVTAGFLMAAWTRDLDARGKVNVQSYYDRMLVDDYLSPTDRTRFDTFDIDATHQIDVFERHAVIWGLGYRASASDIRTGGDTYLDTDQVDHVLSGFLQDEIALSDRFSLTLGSKLERNDYTGFEVEPAARLLYRIAPRHALWAAVSRAVKTPSIAEREATITASAPPSAGLPLPTELAITANGDTEAEKLLAFEIGYRGQVRDDLSIDLATFLNRYDGLLGTRSPGLTVGGFPPVATLPLVRTNNIDADSAGGELSFDYRPTAATRLRAGYSVQWTQAHPTDGTPDAEASIDLVESNSPEHQAFLFLTHKLGERVDLGVAARAVGEVRGGAVDADAYAELDLRLAWRPLEGIELSLVGQNLLHDERQEFASEGPSLVSSEVERLVYGRIAVTF